MINSGDEQKHLNFGYKSREIFSSSESSFVRKSNRFLLLLTDATEHCRIAKQERVLYRTKTDKVNDRKLDRVALQT